MHTATEERDDGSRTWLRWSWVSYAVTLASAYPIGAVIAHTTPQPAGACSGIGFGCGLYGWDAAKFLLFMVGIPYVAGLAVVLALLTMLLPGRWRPALAVVALAGLAVPWGVAALSVASPH